MFLINLCPFPVKEVANFYSWAMIPALNRIDPSKIILLGAPWQIKDIKDVVHGSWVYDLFGKLDLEKFKEARKIIVPGEIIRRWSDQTATALHFMREMSEIGFQEYREWLDKEVGDAIRLYGNITCATTPINCKVLEDVASYHGFPVAHLDAAPFRRPMYNEDTFSFDFGGATGRSEAHERYKLYCCQVAANRLVSLSSLKSAFISDNWIHQSNERALDYEIGVALQDDTNVLCYNNGWDVPQLVFKARQVFHTKQILIRNHPRSRLKIVSGENIGVIDESETPARMLTACKRILTVNSSMAFEAVLNGGNAYVMGDSPYRLIANSTLDRHAWNERRIFHDLERRIDFLALNYFVPWNLYYDQNYLEFRCREKDENLIRDYHIRNYSSRTASFLR